MNVCSATIVLRDRRQEAGGRLTLLVGLLGKAGPDGLDGGQAELAQHDGETGGVDG